MATVTHSKVSAVPDGADTSLVRPSDWNAGHTVSTVYEPGGTDVAVADGGTGASTAAGARTNLGVIAANVPFTPAGTIAATTVQAAIEEVAAEAGGLPAWWTVDSTPTDESVEFAGSVRVAPTDFVGAMIPYVDIDLPSSGGASQGLVTIKFDELPSDTVDVFSIRYADDTPILTLDSGGTVEHYLHSANSYLWTMNDVSPGGGNGELLRILGIPGRGGKFLFAAVTGFDGATEKGFRVGEAGFLIRTMNAAPADADLNPGDLALWLDPTNGALKPMFKAKSADGTVVSGEFYRAGGTDVAVADGGTGASTAAGARTNLGLGTMAVEGTTAAGDLSGVWPTLAVTDDSHSHGAGTAPGSGAAPSFLSVAKWA